MNKSELERLKKRDFFNEGDNFKKKSEIKSVLKIGRKNEEELIVSIVIPSYNRPESLKEAVESALNLSGAYKYQIIISDDTRDEEVLKEIHGILKNFNSDKIVYYWNEERLGLYGNWNRCIELANSQWVVMLHVDEKIDSKYLEKVLPIVEKHKDIDAIGVEPHQYDCYCNFKKYDDSKKCFPLYYELQNCGGIFPVQCSLIKKSCFTEYGGFVSDGAVIEDLSFKIFYTFYYRVYVLDEHLYYKNGLGQSTDIGIWEDQLIYQYYMCKSICSKRKGYEGIILKKYLKMFILKMVLEFNEGKNFFKRKCNIDMSVVKRCCNIRNNYNERQFLKLQAKVDKIQGKLYRKASSNALF